MIKTIGVVLLSLFVSRGYAASINVVGPPSPAVGDTFTVEFKVADITDLYAFQFDLSFDPTLLSAVSVSEGSFLLSGGMTFFVCGTIDNVGGTVAATADTLIGAIQGVTGNGLLAVFQFTALAPGTTELSFANPILVDSSLNDITASAVFQNGSVTINDGSAVPEPRTLALFCTAFLGFMAARCAGRAHRKPPRS